MLRRCRLIVLFLTVTFIPALAFAQRVRTSYGGTSGYNVPLWVAQEAGFFKKQGLTSELILISGDADGRRTQKSHLAGKAGRALL